MDKQVMKRKKDHTTSVIANHSEVNINNKKLKTTTTSATISNEKKKKKQSKVQSDPSLEYISNPLAAPIVCHAKNFFRNFNLAFQIHLGPIYEWVK